MKTIIGLLLLGVVNLIHCQEQAKMIGFTLQGILETLESINDKLKGYEELLQRIPDMQGKLEHLENNLQDVQQKLGNHETNFQELHHELEHMKGAAINNQEYLERLSQETKQCLRGDDLEHLTNVSAVAHQEIKSFVHEEMSGVISLAQKDECSEGNLPCGEIGICQNTLFSFTCSCPSGFTWDGSECKDIDECAEGLCSPNAICENSIGNFSCFCNTPFEGDGKTSCEFECRTNAKFISGLGCIQRVDHSLSFSEMKDFCQEEGGRLVQHMSQDQLEHIQKSLSTHSMWAGVYDGKWTSDESLVPEDLWEEGRYRPDPSRRCGFIILDSSSTYKLTQKDCSEIDWGYCQFQMTAPQPHFDDYL